MKKIFIILLLLSLPVAAGGCLAAAVGYAGYAVSSSKEEAAAKEAEAKHIQSYNSYKTEMEKLNLDREKAGLKPNPVMTYPEWKLAHNIPTRAPEPGKKETAKESEQTEKETAKKE